MATADIWVAKREKLRESRKARNDWCLSRAPAPTGIREDMVRPVSCFFEARAAIRSASLSLITPWLTPAPLSMGLRRWAARHCACKSPAVIIARGGFGIMLQLQSAFGVLALLVITWALGENRHAVSWR